MISSFLSRRVSKNFPKQHNFNSFSIYKRNPTNYCTQNVKEAPQKIDLKETNKIVSEEKMKTISVKNESEKVQNFSKKTPTSSDTFVSSYYKFDDSVFIPYLTRKNIAFRKNEKGQIIVKDCPFCHDTKSNISNLWKLYIYTDNGKYFCFRCNSQGSWYEIYILS